MHTRRYRCTCVGVDRRTRTDGCAATPLDGSGCAKGAPEPNGSGAPYALERLSYENQFSVDSASGAATSAAFSASLTTACLAETGSLTSSITAIGALSPGRVPILVMRV